MNRGNQFKEDEGAWKGEGDGKVVNNQPQRVMMDGQHMMASGYIGKYVIRIESLKIFCVCSFLIPFFYVANTQIESQMMRVKTKWRRMWAK